MNQIVSNGFWGFLEPMAKQVADPQGDTRLQKKPPKSEDVKLSFTTQRMLRAKSAEEVGDIMLNASPTEALSSEATVAIPANRRMTTLENLTVQTKLTIKQFKRSQAFTLLMTSMMGFLIGVFVGLFL